MVFAAAILLGGCAHFDPQPGWHCTAEVEEGKLTASTVRTLTHDGRQIRVRSEWLRGYDLAPRSLFRGEWAGTSHEPDFGGGRIYMEYSVPAGGLYDLELRRGSPHAAAVDRNLRGRRERTVPGRLAVPWPMMQQLLTSGDALFLVAIDSRGAVLAHERLDPQLFHAGYRAATATADRSRAMIADFRGRCDEHQEIILT